MRFGGIGTAAGVAYGNATGAGSAATVAYGAGASSYFGGSGSLGGDLYTFFNDV